MKQVLNILFVSGLLFSAVAAAHVPISRCEIQAEMVLCQARYDDNSRATRVQMQVYSYDNEVLLTGRSDQKGEFNFILPDQPFYLLMDDGPGHGFEVDWRDIDGINPEQFNASSY